MTGAILFEKLERDQVECRLCRHHCLIAPGKTGLCAVRRNEGGDLVTLVYDRVAAAGADPIEKKPLFHFYPGSRAWSVATMGCNFSCLHCQNASLSRTPAEGGAIDGRPTCPAEIVAQAEASGCRSISFTYSEPTVFAELALETARLAHEKGIANNFVTNGYQSAEMVAAMTGLIDAANVDLKSFSADFYRKVCGAALDGVLETIGLLHQAGLWLEITTLVIPSRNDSDAELRSIARFIAGIDRNIPWHVSAFRPANRMRSTPSTPPSTLFKAVDLGKAEGLRFIYTGNIAGRGGENTLCPECGALLIERTGYFVTQNRLHQARCPDCDAAIAGVFE